ncbi:MAG: nucleotide exchange factor GrpE [Bacteroidota bacterium]
MEKIEGNNQNGSAQEDENKIPIEKIEGPKPDAEDQQAKIELIEAELRAALEKNNELEKLNAELKDTLLRKVADFENYKRRNENDQLNIFKYAAEPFIRSILPVYDDLERSLSHIDEANKFEQTKKGLQLVFEKFGKILESYGIYRIDAKGKPFDVQYHEALMQQPAEDVAPHTVLEVLEPGYIYKDRVIRHAKVIVSQEMDQSQISQDENQNKHEDNSTEKV